MKIWQSADIKKLRTQYRLSQKALGELLGVSRNYIYYLERGERIPSKTLMLLLDYVSEKLKEQGVKI